MSENDGKSHAGTASDVYSFACIIYEILFEIMPWGLDDIESMFDLRRRILENVFILFYLGFKTIHSK
jgi:serine/threonine protein kinase